VIVNINNKIQVISNYIIYDFAFDYNKLLSERYFALLSILSSQRKEHYQNVFSV